VISAVAAVGQGVRGVVLRVGGSIANSRDSDLMFEPQTQLRPNQSCFTTPAVILIQNTPSQNDVPPTLPSNGRLQIQPHQPRSINGDLRSEFLF